MGKFIKKLSKDLKSKKVKATIPFTVGWNKTIQEPAIQLQKAVIKRSLLLGLTLRNNFVILVMQDLT